MNEQSTTLEIAIYRKTPALFCRINELDLGSLLNQLTEHPVDIAGGGENGSIEIKIQRTHEWEIVIILALAGSGIFLKGVLTKLGERFGDWLAIRYKDCARPEALAQ